MARKLYFDDDQQFPDTQYVTFEFPGNGKAKRQLLVYEQRIWSPSLQDGLDDGNAFYGTEGYMILSKHTGWKLYDPKGKVLKEEEGEYSVPEHAADFLDAIRSNKRPERRHRDRPPLGHPGPSGQHPRQSRTPATGVRSEDGADRRRPGGRTR